MTALLAWVTAPLWGTMSYVEAGWLLLTAGCLLYLRGHLCDARAQARAAQDDVERRAAVADVWLEVKEILIQACFGAVGLYGALTPSSPVEPGRAVGALGVTGLFVSIQLANLVFAHYRRESRRWITEELRRQARELRRVPAGATPIVGGRRSYDTSADSSPRTGREAPR